MKRRRFLAFPLALAAGRAFADVEYARVVPRALDFPRDHGAHPEFRIEWWYVTGALDTPPGDAGFPRTFFRRGPGMVEDLACPIPASRILSPAAVRGQGSYAHAHAAAEQDYLHCGVLPSSI